MFYKRCKFFATHCCGVCLPMRVPRPFQHNIIYADGSVVVVSLTWCITSCRLFVLLTEVLILRTTDAFFPPRNQAEAPIESIQV